jgi:hypothetical protein
MIATGLNWKPGPTRHTDRHTEAQVLTISPDVQWIQHTVPTAPPLRVQAPHLCMGGQAGAFGPDPDRPGAQLRIPGNCVLLVHIPASALCVKAFTSNWIPTGHGPPDARGGGPDRCVPTD